MNEITQWLAAANKDYAFGLKLLKRLSPDNKKMQFLACCSSDALGSLHFNILVQEVKNAFRIHLANGTLDRVQSPPKPIEAMPLDTTRRKFVFNDIVDVKSLPEELQKLYFRNQEITRLLAGLHQELKTASSNASRKELAEKISTLNQERITNWKQLDSFSEGESPVDVAEKKEKPDGEPNDQISELKHKIGHAEKELASGKLSKGQQGHRKRMITTWTKKLNEYQAK
jgi:hypothetical protein